MHQLLKITICYYQNSLNWTTCFCLLTASTQSTHNLFLMTRGCQHEQTLRPAVASQGLLHCTEFRGFLCSSSKWEQTPRPSARRLRACMRACVRVCVCVRVRARWPLPLLSSYGYYFWASGRCQQACFCCTRSTHPPSEALLLISYGPRSQRSF